MRTESSSIAYQRDVASLEQHMVDFGWIGGWGWDAEPSTDFTLL